jgi:tetratricopeptide (TPR) repeat protein
MNPLLLLVLLLSSPQSAAEFVSQAQAKEKAGDPDGAIADFSRAITLAPKDAEIYGLRAAVKKAKGDTAGALADYTAGMHMVQGILFALLQRERTGVGQKVSVSLYNSMLAMQMQEAAMIMMADSEVNWAAMPLSGVFETRTGALWLQDVWRITPDLKLTLGGRLETWRATNREPEQHVRHEDDRPGTDVLRREESIDPERHQPGASQEYEQVKRTCTESVHSMIRSPPAHDRDLQSNRPRLRFPQTDARDCL